MLDRLKFSHKIVLMPALAAAAFLLVLLVTHVASRRNQQLLAGIESGYAPALELSHELETTLADIQRGLQDAVAIRDEELLGATDDLAGRFLGRLARGRQVDTLEDEELALLERQFQQYYGTATDVTRRMIGDETGVPLARDLERMQTELNAVQSRVSEFSRRQRAAMEDAFRTAQRNQRLSLWRISAVTVLFLVALILVSWWIVGSLNRQLGQAVAVADGLARGEEAEIRVTSRDEIGHLLLHMGTMVERVRERTRDLEREVSERRRVEGALRESEERYALAARGASDGLWDWDLRSRRLYLSPRWLQMLGLDHEPSGDLEEWLGRIHPSDREAVEHQLELHRIGVVPHFESEHRIRHSDGRYLWVLSRGLAVHDEAGHCYRIAGSHSDITERKRGEEQLIHDAFHDSLTGLPNRALFRDRLGQALRVAKKRESSPFAVLFLDLDRFKVINDSLGHLVGDELLTIVATRIEECLRPEDTVARLGGDEFAILLDSVSAASGAVLAAERVQRRISRPCTIQDHEVVVTVSIGIALSSTGYERPEDVQRDADIAMYRAKARGKARYAVFDAAMHAQSMALLKLEMDLRRAIERDELRVHYQPIVGLADAKIVGLEALVRWEHPERGLILPLEFIPMAEETGLIVPIGEIVLEQVLGQMRRWRTKLADGVPRISVNLSARQLSEPQLVDRVSAILGNGGQPREALGLEITESALMQDATAAVRVLHRLRDLDVRLYVDDFGTGYSSLAYLHRLPIDSLKIDQSFVSGMRRDGTNGEVVRAIVTLAHGLDMDVVAEGVEHDHQLRYLQSVGCEHGQGFLFAPALEPDAVEGLLVAGDPLLGLEPRSGPGP